MLKALEKKKKRFEELQVLVADPKVISNNLEYQRLARELSGLKAVVDKYDEYMKVAGDIKDLIAVLAEKGHDTEYIRMVHDEKAQLEKKLAGIELELESLLFEDTEGGNRDIIMEIRAGVGGEEAALFAKDLFKMYVAYAESKGWKTELLDSHPTDIGGLKEIIFSISGGNVYKYLKYESGVHRVQRVPETEASGRIHTSTATVAVLPEAEDVEVDINPDDLRIDVFHASGHGGQNVQKVSTAIRLFHKPTGITVTCQDERSQLQNKTKAMRILRARLYDLYETQKEQEIVTQRRAQIGRGNRNERIRTYNFPQGRVTDHRINLSLYNLPVIMEGNLSELIEALIDEEQRELLEELESN